MNQTMELILNRKSVRAYEKREIEDAVKDQVLEAAMRAPTAGNMMLYSIVQVEDQRAKETLARTCDNQPFIAKAPWVLLFLADYQRWHDYFVVSGVEEQCKREGIPMRTPQEGDLFLACCDALIAAHTAVIAAESLGLSSCYIGDIMENYETHRDLFDLPRYVFPIALVCFGYPTRQQRERSLTRRFQRQFIVFEDRYRRLGPDEFQDMYREAQAGMEEGQNIGQLMYVRKFNSDFGREMSRSVRAILRAWTGA